MINFYDLQVMQRAKQLLASVEVNVSEEIRELRWMIRDMTLPAGGIVIRDGKPGT